MRRQMRTVSRAARPAHIDRLESRQLLSTTTITPAFTPPPNGIPGTIEVENYDLGGEGVAYHAPAPAKNGVYRADSIGLVPTSDAGGGYLLAYDTPGTWLNYTATVSNTATYTVDLRVASLNPGTAHLSADGKAITGAISIPNTGGWNTWRTISVANVNLTAGRHVIRLSFDTATNPRVGVACVNWLRFRDNPVVSDRTAWWRSAKYGMFVHFGLYSALAGHWANQIDKGYGEWIMKDLNVPESAYATAVPPLFNPYAYSAQTWVNVAKQAGMKYIVVTSKHHEGFSMFNTRVSNYSVVKDTKWAQDPLAPLSTAAHAAGLGFGVYYSIMDWHHPELATTSTSAGAKSPTDPAVVNYVNNVMKPQLRELITQYNPDILWFDGEWVPWWNTEYGREIEEYVRSLKTGIIINNRVGKRASTDGDYDTPEQVIPAGSSPNRLWETAMTLNDTWGYKDFDTNWKSPTTVIQNLVNVASKGGNFLLNVGPDGSGTIPPAAVGVLQQVGNWLSTNGSAIYGTTASPHPTEPWGSLTRKGSSLYAVVFNWPANGYIHLDVAGTVSGVHMLASGAPVSFTSTPTGITLALPLAKPQEPAGVVKIDFSSGIQGL